MRRSSEELGFTGKARECRVARNVKVRMRDGVELSDILRDLEGKIDRNNLYGVGG